MDAAAQATLVCVKPAGLAMMHAVSSILAATWKLGMGGEFAALFGAMSSFDGRVDHASHGSDQAGMENACRRAATILLASFTEDSRS